MRYQSIKRIASIVFVVAALMATSASAQYVLAPGTGLPPGGSFYFNPPNQPVTITGPIQLPGITISNIVLTDLIHTPGTFITNGILPSGDYYDEFNSTLTGAATINITGDGTIVGQLTGTGPATVIVGNGYTNGAVGGPWTTGLSLNFPVQVSWTNGLPGSPIGFYLSCSNSPGSTSVTDLGGGVYRIDSYFDVWPEISFDEHTWIPADSSVPMYIIPEPSSLVLVGLGALVLAIRSRKCLE